MFNFASKSCNLPWFCLGTRRDGNKEPGGRDGPHFFSSSLFFSSLLALLVSLFFAGQFFAGQASPGRALFRQSCHVTHIYMYLFFVLPTDLVSSLWPVLLPVTIAFVRAGRACLLLVVLCWFAHFSIAIVQPPAVDVQPVSIAFQRGLVCTHVKDGCCFHWLL